MPLGQLPQKLRAKRLAFIEPARRSADIVMSGPEELSPGCSAGSIRLGSCNVLAGRSDSSINKACSSSVGWRSRIEGLENPVITLHRPIQRKLTTPGWTRHMVCPQPDTLYRDPFLPTDARGMPCHQGRRAAVDSVRLEILQLFSQLNPNASAVAWHRGKR